MKCVRGGMLQRNKSVLSMQADAMDHLSQVIYAQCAKSGSNHGAEYGEDCDCAETDCETKTGAE